MKNRPSMQKTVQWSWAALAAIPVLQIGGCSLFQVETLTRITVNALLSPVSEILFDALTSIGGGGG